jgi:hypothetical protein
MVCFHVLRVAQIVPPLAPAKVLRADASVPTRWLVEGAVGGRKHGGSGERGLARRSRGLEATAGDIAH